MIDRVEIWDSPLPQNELCIIFWQYCHNNKKAVFEKQLQLQDDSMMLSNIYYNLLPSAQDGNSH